MIQRLNPYKASPNGVAALVGVEKYIEACGSTTGSSRW